VSRPTSYDPAFCDRVIELGKEGKSVTQMACELDVVKQTLHNWAAEFPEFLDAFTKAKQWSQDWWETKGQKGLEGGVNPSLWSRSMAARFPDDYTERQKRELTGKDGGPVEQVHRIERVIVDPANTDS
jgi:transposase-like protein